MADGSQGRSDPSPIVTEIVRGVAIATFADLAPGERADDAWLASVRGPILALADLDSPRDVLVDFRAAAIEPSSEFLSYLMMLKKRLGASDRRLALCRLNDWIRESIRGPIVPVFRIFADRASALAFLDPAGTPEPPR